MIYVSRLLVIIKSFRAGIKESFLQQQQNIFCSFLQHSTGKEESLKKNKSKLLFIKSNKSKQKERQ